MESIIELSGPGVEILKTLALVLMPFLITGIGFLMRNSIKGLVESNDELSVKFVSMDKEFVGLKKDMEGLTKAMNTISHIRDEWAGMKSDVAIMVLEIKSLKSAIEEIVIIKRDQQTIWKRIDELQVSARRGKR